MCSSAKYRPSGNRDANVNGRRLSSVQQPDSVKWDYVTTTNVIAVCWPVAGPVKSKLLPDSEARKSHMLTARQ
jgi:hypothetical protein